MEIAGKEWKSDVLATATDRFERRLADECGKLRVEMANGFSTLRDEMHKGLADVRVEMLKWSFAFWVSQIVTLGGIVALLLRAT